MNFLCHVNCCINQSVIPGVTYHKFPKTVAELWFSVHNIPVRKVENVSEMIVCSDHFKLDDYVDTEGRLKLKNGAVPSLYLKIPKDDDIERHIVQSVLVPNNKEDTSCVVINQVDNLQLPSMQDKLFKVTVLQSDNDPDIDKTMEVTDIIAIADESDILTAINAMHNYSVSVQTHVDADHQNKLSNTRQVCNNLLTDHCSSVRKAPSYKRKLRNQKESPMLRNKTVASRIEQTTERMNEEMIENIILDHDYITPDESAVGELENVDNNGAADVNAYNMICSENYVWKLKKQLGLYSRKTRCLRKRLDSLKTVVNVLKKRIF